MIQGSIPIMILDAIPRQLTLGTIPDIIQGLTPHMILDVIQEPIASGTLLTRMAEDIEAKKMPDSMPRS